MAPETILTKIQKLLTFQKGAEKIGSLEEAANAAEKIQTLLIKHNLEMSDVSSHTPKTGQEIGRAIYRDIYAKKNEGQWIYSLYATISEHNFCKTILTPFRRDNSYELNHYVNIVGKKENVEVVKFLADQLENRIRILEKDHWENYKLMTDEKRNTFRRGFFMGAVNGIGHQLRMSKERAMRESTQVYGLVKANDKMVEKALQDMFPNLKSGKSSQNTSSQIGSTLGYIQGKTMNINNGVGQGNGNTALK